MKLRIQNNARGARGIYVNEELVFVAAGATQTYSKALASERDDAAAVAEFRVWTDTGEGWEEVTKAKDAPVARPFLAIAKGSKGENMRSVDLDEGEWFLGTALVSDKPDGPQGYEWVKVGAGVQTDAPEVPVANYRAPVETMNVGGGSAFDPAVFVNDLMPDVIANLEGKTPEQLAAILAAENSREKPRKGVTNAVEEMLGKANGSEENA